MVLVLDRKNYTNCCSTADRPPIAITLAWNNLWCRLYDFSPLKSAKMVRLMQTRRTKKKSMPSKVNRLILDEDSLARP